MHMQLSICLRYVDPQTLQIHEDCVGLYATDRTDASTVAKLILHMLVRFNLPVKNCRDNFMTERPIWLDEEQVLLPKSKR